jgi:hypothetical protein
MEVVMRRFLLTSVGVAVVVLGLSAADEKKEEKKVVNLLVNGSFEDGPDAGAFVSLDEKDTQMKGWTVIKGQIYYIGTYWQAAEGSGASTCTARRGWAG